jgi:integrase/recombinase XerD
MTVGPTTVPSAKTAQREARRPPGRPSELFPPERRYLRYSAWPEADRRALETAIAPLGPFDAPRAAAHWRPVTVRIRCRAYSRYLSWLRRQGLLVAEETPAERLTPERLTAYLQEFRQAQSLCSVDQSLRELRLIMQALAPERDWRWINKNPLRPRWAQVKASKRPKKVFSPVELVGRALDVMDDLETKEVSTRRCILFRDSLMTALMCLVPLRRKNLAEIRIGTHLFVDGDVIRLNFEETKTSALITTIVPSYMQPYITAYLTRYREFLRRGRTTSALWVAFKNKDLDYVGVGHAFDRMGRLVFGHPITAHMFRYSVATAIMTRDPRRGIVAAGTLGHKGLRTLTEYYDQSGDAGAHSEWARIRKALQRLG